MKAQCLGVCSHLCCLHTVPYEQVKIKVCVVLLVWMMELSMESKSIIKKETHAFFKADRINLCII